MGKKEFKSLDCNTGTDPVASKLFITDDFNVLLWQLTSGMQQLITIKAGKINNSELMLFNNSLDYKKELVLITNLTSHVGNINIYKQGDFTVSDFVSQLETWHHIVKSTG